MATDKTRLTELATAVGLVWDPSLPWPEGLKSLEVPGIDPTIWHPAVLPATNVGSPQRELLMRALENGRAFRREVLDGRMPNRVDWQGGTRSVWTSDIPRDLTVDGVWFIQAKYDSTCVLNTSPGSLVDELLVDQSNETRPSWFEEVALDQLQAFYRRIVQLDSSLPADVRHLEQQSKALVKSLLSNPSFAGLTDDSYRDLCRAVSLETTLRWRHHLEHATVPQRTQMLFRMLRISGGPYWLLGVKGHDPVRLRVDDTRSWRQRFELKSFLSLIHI